jgi:hypothetical protein
MISFSLSSFVMKNPQGVLFSGCQTRGGIAQLVERLVRKDFLGFCDLLGPVWTVRD